MYVNRYHSLIKGAFRLMEKEEITHKLNRSYAVIHPSYYETQGIAVLEAINLGKPVIVSQL